LIADFAVVLVGEDSHLPRTIPFVLFFHQTASVRSIINELQDEQASGNLPEFNFIALNGMEMRSPFDSYVKFWEALSGTRKERLSAGAAAAKLEDYFGDGERYESREDRSKKPITVLMLDEIDYLVTKKQTILCK
jgi:origin recognition complex subunit 1